MTSTDATITIAQLHRLSGIATRALQHRASTERWPYDERAGKGRGGKVRHYLIDRLPEEIRFYFYKPPTVRQSDTPVKSTDAPDLATISQPKLKRAGAKTDLLLHYTRAIKSAGWGKKAIARDNFMTAYNSGFAYPQLFATLGAVSWQTIEGWKRTLKKGGDLSDLADRRGTWRRGKSLVTAEQARILLECALHPNRPLVAEVIREAKRRMDACGIQNGHSPATYRRFIEEFKRNNFDVWTFAREGAKALNDKALLSIERDPSLINVGDILVADGHTLNFEILNPWTGREQRMTLLVFYDMRSNYPCGWEIMPTEDTTCISAALRRAILTLGKMPQVVYLDNGKAFGAKYFTGNLAESGLAGLYERLGIKTIFAWPYHGQSKTVERFFSNFADLERWCPTYTGNCIDNKPPRMMRGERLHRKVYEKIMGGRCLTMEMAHRAIAEWFDRYAQRRQERSKYLMGYSPAEVFMPERGPGVESQELTYLMMADRQATVRASRIEFAGRKYYHEELYRRRHKVQIRYDLHDPGYVLVYDRDELLCIAREQEGVHPAAHHLGSDQDREKLAYYCKLKKRQEKQATRLARRMLESEILPAHRQQLDRDGLLPDGRPQPETKPQTKALTIADKQRIENEVATYRRQKKEEKPDVWAELEHLGEADKYEQLVRFGARGLLIPREHAAFMRYFEQTSKYFQLERTGYWENVRTAEILLHRASGNTPQTAMKG